MTLEDLGYNSILADYRKEQNLDSFSVARVTAVHKDRYDLRTAEAEYDAEVIGSLRFSAESAADFPAIGDWVAITEYDEGKALIHHVFPRSSVIERQAIGKPGQKQIIASNIDFGLIVLAVGRDFSINRLERYLTICHAAGVRPIIILNKIDLVTSEELATLQAEIKQRIAEVPIIAMSNETQQGYSALASHIEKGKTYCLLGSSGVGKSTLLNNLSGQELMNTGEISASANRGKHVTSHRELILLDNGGILIDNPGMRSVGVADSAEGLEITFDDITQLAQNCKFNNCTHVHEKGCAILEALENDELDEDLYNNYQKMVRETSHFAANVAERRKKAKDFSKMVKRTVKAKKKFKD